MNLLFILVSFSLVIKALSERNRLIRVDGINPTCFMRPECRDFETMGAVISVDKSLPFMGSNMCCINFTMATLDDDAYFMARISKYTVLEGDDFISFFEDEFNLIRNITSDDPDPYKTIYFTSPKISVEFYKDKNYRSIYEIIVSVYYLGNSPVCKKDTFYRCSSNTSICIDDELTCDKFPHCPNESDEDLCNSIQNETTMSYDKNTIAIVLFFLIGVIIMTILLIILLCFCKSREKLTETFMSIFGYRSDSKNSKMLDAKHRLVNEYE